MASPVQPVLLRLARRACPSRRLVSKTTTTTTTRATAVARPPSDALRRRFFGSVPPVAALFRSSRPLFSPPPPPPSSAPTPAQSADPAAAAAQPAELTPADLTTAEYHALADEYLERLVGHLEAMQDAREDVDVEYSSGVLTLSLAAHSDGSGGTRTYVINKQPPNKQIWLSSPLSGPKRYDWVLDAGAGAGAAGGRWVYLKDGSALDGLLLAEVGVDMTVLADE